MLEYDDTPIAKHIAVDATLTTALLQKSPAGPRWRSMTSTLISRAQRLRRIQGTAPGGCCRRWVERRYQRIRAAQYQAVTVAEPLNLLELEVGGRG
jgi:hypothetical protein